MSQATFDSDEACYHVTCHVISQDTRMWSMEVIPMQPMELLFILSKLECGVQCFAMGILDPFSPKTPLTRREALT
jgi:hypothetical protein